MQRLRALEYDSVEPLLKKLAEAAKDNVCLLEVAEGEAFAVLGGCEAERFLVERLVGRIKNNPKVFEKIQDALTDEIAK